MAVTPVDLSSITASRPVQKSLDVLKLVGNAVWEATVPSNKVSLLLSTATILLGFDTKIQQFYDHAIQYVAGAFKWNLDARAKAVARIATAVAVSALADFVAEKAGVEKKLVDYARAVAVTPVVWRNVVQLLTAEEQAEQAQSQ